MNENPKMSPPANATGGDTRPLAARMMPIKNMFFDTCFDRLFLKEINKISGCSLRSLLDTTFSYAGSAAASFVVKSISISGGVKSVL